MGISLRRRDSRRGLRSCARRTAFACARAITFARVSLAGNRPAARELADSRRCAARPSASAKAGGVAHSRQGCISNGNETKSSEQRLAVVAPLSTSTACGRAAKRPAWWD